LAELAGSSEAGRPPVATSASARALFIALGSVLVAIGILGVILPLLPHTIFFLLAAACYARGSERAYTWLMTNRLFGRYLRNYRERRGATLATKIVTIAMLWGGLALSAWLATPPVWVYAILAAVGVGVPIYLVRLRTLRD